MSNSCETCAKRADGCTLNWITCAVYKPNAEEQRRLDKEEYEKHPQTVWNLTMNNTVSHGELTCKVCSMKYFESRGSDGYDNYFNDGAVPADMKCFILKKQCNKDGRLAGCPWKKVNE